MNAIIKTLKALFIKKAHFNGRSLLSPQSLNGVRVFATTVIRRSNDTGLTGYLMEIDWIENQVIKQIPIPLKIQQPFWNARGGNRGGRGIFLKNGVLYVASAMGVLQYDRDLNKIGEITSQYFAGLHEIFIDREGMWVTSTIHDLIVKIDFEGKVIDEWWGSESDILQKELNFDRRNINLNIFDNDSSVEQYCSEEKLHLNTVWTFDEKVYVLSCWKNAFIKIRPLPEEVVLVDKDLSSPHNGIITPDGRIIINDTRNQYIRTYDLSGRRLSTFATQIFSNKRSEQFANAGWQRGLSHMKDSIYLVGTSPATVFEIDIDRRVIGQICRIAEDVRHCIHGLTTVWNF